MISKKFIPGSIPGIFLIIMLAAVIIISGCIGGGNGGEQPVDKTKTDRSLEEILNLEESLSYTISYDITGKNIDGRSGMTMYLAGDKNRIDMTSEASGKKTENSIFQVGTNSYTCAKEKGEWMCIKFSGNVVGDVKSSYTPSGNDSGKAVYDGEQNIMGISAKCYKLEVDTGKYKYCVHPQTYMMLLSEVYSEGSLEYGMVATKVDLNTPDDSVFELPAEPMDFESGMRNT